MKSITKIFGVDDISYGQSWVENYAALVKSFSYSSLLLIAVLLAGSLFVVGNSIRNSISLRREEIEILELVGATRSMIMMPYIFEGAIMGFFASALSCGICYLIFVWQASIINSSLGFWGLGSQFGYLAADKVFLLLLLGIVFGAFGAFLCVRKLSNGWAASYAGGRNVRLVLVFSLIFCFGAVEKPKIKELAKNYERTKEKVLESDKNQRKILRSLYKATIKTKTMSRSRDKLTDQMLGIREDVKKVAKEIAKLEHQNNLKKKVLSKRLRALYKMGEEGVLRTIFSSSNANEFDKNLKFLKLISEKDYDVIKEYELNLKKLKQKKTKLKVRVTKLLLIKNKLKSKEKELEKEQRTKQQLLSKLKRQKNWYIKQMQGIKDKSKNLAGRSVIASYFSSTFFENKGRLPQPVNAKVKHSYGVNLDPEYAYRLSHKGYFYDLAIGSEVKSVHEGKVVFAGFILGYGQTVVIDHGDHYYTVYGNNSKLNVKTGEFVQASQVISLSGLAKLEQDSDFILKLDIFQML